MKMEHVRSLSMFDLEGHTQMLDRLGEFSLLRVLDLEDCMDIENKHLIHVCQMYLLRYLGLKGAVISKLPPEVGELENLETLDVRETYLEDLPKTVSKLEKLEHLQINNKDSPYSKGWIARKGLGKMKALRMVNTVVFGCDADAAKELGELQQLRELRITMDIRNPDDTHHKDVREKLVKSLSKMYSLRWLSIGSVGYDDMDALKFLHDLDPSPRLLQYLRIGAGINELPKWVGSLNNLVELVIAWTGLVGAQLLDPLCKLPNLQRMYLESFCYKDTKLVAKTAHTFSALKELQVNFYLCHLEFEAESMANLEILSVCFSTRDSLKVSGIEHLTNLKEVKLSGKKNNPALHSAVEQLKTMNEKRAKLDQLKVVVKYE